MEFEEILVIAYIFGLVYFAIWFWHANDINRRKHKIVIIAFGYLLVIASILFWFKYGLVRETWQFPPPITAIVVCFGFFAMLSLMVNNDRVELIFGERTDSDSRRSILRMLGVIFTAFILMLTLLWSLPGKLHSGVLYDQTYLLAGLFFYIVGSFYCILADLNQ